jgi:hypothetical protein
MLQYDPSINAIDIPQILRQTARLDAFTGLVRNGTWGFGKLDARTATGFGRRTVVINGVPATVSIPLVTNGTTTSVAGGSWNDFYFIKGSTFNVSFDSLVQPTSDTRYVLYQMPLASGGMDQVLVANYTTQYLLSINSPFGSTSGTGWYDANSNATISAPAFVPGPGISGYLGVGYILAHWSTNTGGTVGSNVILMDGPKSLTAVYWLTIVEPTFLEVLIASTVAVVATVFFARRKLS